MYKVLIQFTDGEHGTAWPLDKGGFAYAVGDVYPKDGFKPTEEHLSYLLGCENRFGKPVIEMTVPPTKPKAKKIKAEDTKE